MTITDIQPATVDAATAPAARIESIRKSYGDREVLRGITFEVQAGEVFGILGPNGAGKTTLVECMVGLRRPDAGHIEVLGMDPTTDRHRFTSRVSVQPQDASLFENIRVREALDLFSSFHARSYDTDAVLELIGLEDSQRQLVRKLSGGQRRRLLLGVSMIGAPELIVLDEPSAGLDPAARRSLWSVITGLRDAGTTVLLTTHHMDEASTLCDRVAFVVDGEVRALDRPSRLVSQLAPEQVVTFETTAGPGEVRLRLAAEATVLSVSLSEERGATAVTVRTTDSDRVLALVAGAAGWHPRSMGVDRGDLETVFLSVAGGHTSTTSHTRTTSDTPTSSTSPTSPTSPTKE